MPRPPRSDEPGAWHHVYNRGARRAPIFQEDAHCVLFLDLLADVVDRLRLEVHAYALMPNHYHLLVRSPNGNLSTAMKRLIGFYTVQVNRLNKWDGPVFRGRYSSRRITDEDWLTHVLAYIHLNPVKARLVHRPDEPCWTSHRAYVGLEPIPAWLTTAVLGAKFGTDGLDAYLRDLHIGRAEWPTALNTTDGWLKPGRFLPRASASRLEAPQALSAEAVVERVSIVCGLSRAALEQVKRGRGGNPARRFLMWALADGALMSQVEIARRLGVTPPHVCRVLGQLGRAAPTGPIAAWLSAWAALKMLDD